MSGRVLMVQVTLIACTSVLLLLYLSSGDGALLWHALRDWHRNSGLLLLRGDEADVNDLGAADVVEGKVKQAVQEMRNGMMKEIEALREQQQNKAVEWTKLLHELDKRRKHDVERDRAEHQRLEAKLQALGQRGQATTAKGAHQPTAQGKQEDGLRLTPEGIPVPSTLPPPQAVSNPRLDAILAKRAIRFEVNATDGQGRPTVHEGKDVILVVFNKGEPVDRVPSCLICADGLIRLGCDLQATSTSCRTSSAR